MFHCLEVASEGGENLLVDGFSIAQQFKDKYPEGYAFLSSESFPSEYLEEGQHHTSLDTVFKHNPETGCVSQFRFVLTYHLVDVVFSVAVQMGRCGLRTDNEMFYSLRRMMSSGLYLLQMMKNVALAV